MTKRHKLKPLLTLPPLVLINLLSFSQGKIIVNGATVKAENGAYIITKDVSVKSAGTININNSTIKIADSIVNTSGTFNVTAGTVEMNGTSPQKIPSGAFSTNKIMNLVISNNVNLAGQDSVTNVLSFGGSNKIFTTGNFLTLKSTFLNTARLADITNGGANTGNTITGAVHVERYITAVRAWRFLTAPINTIGTQSINQAWQEGASNPALAYSANVNPVPGFGMHITGGSPANGFDQGVNANAAIKKYVAGTWVALTNTKPTMITSENGFMVFFRGGRSTNLSQGTYAAVTSTVLRSTGTLKTNDQVYVVADTGFTVIGNPYASPINLNKIGKTNSTNIQDNFYLWDPNLTGSNGVGAYVNVSWNGSAYDVTPSGQGSSNLNQYVQSGSAFLARSFNNTTAGSLVIKETDKVGININANRVAGSVTGKLKTNLYSFNADGTTALVDGILNSFDDMYSDAIDHYDAVKVKNTNESFFTVRNGVSLTVERKQLVTDEDTIFINMLKMQIKYYKFEFAASNFDPGGLTAFLEDSYTKTQTVIDLTGKTVYNFNVINVPGSWNPSRFRIVFKQLHALPVTLSSIKAFVQNENILVQWKVENQQNIKQYEVEISADGQQFNRAVTLDAKGSSSGTITYNWLDKNVMEGNNYYRVKSVGVNGESRYSDIVKVNIGKNNTGIVLTTNIITGKTLTFQMNNMPKGSYAVSITNSIGQFIYKKKIEHDNGSSTENIDLDNNFTSGIYYLNIVKPDLSDLTIKFLVD